MIGRDGGRVTVRGVRGWIHIDFIKSVGEETRLKVQRGVVLTWRAWSSVPPLHQSDCRTLPHPPPPPGLPLWCSQGWGQSLASPPSSPHWSSSSCCRQKVWTEDDGRGEKSDGGLQHSSSRSTSMMEVLMLILMYL